MTGKMKFVTSFDVITARSGLSCSSAPANLQRSGDGGHRPHQKAVDVNDLTLQERDELARLLETELARH